jgi:AraC-like DNA-binding protein
MLHYVGHGERRFGLKPMLPHERGRWEFMAVCEGRIGPILADDSQPGLSERTLWVFGPSVCHGWTGDGARRAEVVVIHLASVPRPLQRAVAPKGFVEARLTARDCAALRETREALSNELLNPTELSDVVAQRAQAELTLLALRDTEPRPLPVGPRRDRIVVDTALTYLEEHLEESPTLQQVAREVGSSPAHLRRLFSRVLESSPRAVLEQMRIERAMSILSRSDADLEQVARTCGYSQASALSRAFRRISGVAPGRWRHHYQLPVSPRER